jgi:tRNA(Ile)-lysidine synthetase-like protein
VAAGAAVSVATRRPGLRLRRSDGHTRKLQDLLVDARVPRWERDALPLVFLAGELAWIPGVAADPRAVLPTSEPGLHLEFVPGLGEKVAW